jgi:hypothetical protein
VKIRVFVFESFDVLNLYFNLIEESVENNLVEILGPIVPPLVGFTWNVPNTHYQLFQPRVGKRYFFIVSFPKLYRFVSFRFLIFNIFFVPFRFVSLTISFRFVTFQIFFVPFFPFRFLNSNMYFKMD